jgi:hypothetical protein
VRGLNLHIDNLLPYEEVVKKPAEQCEAWARPARCDSPGVEVGISDIGDIMSTHDVVVQTPRQGAAAAGAAAPAAAAPEAKREAAAKPAPREKKPARDEPKKAPKHAERFREDRDSALDDEGRRKPRGAGAGGLGRARGGREPDWPARRESGGLSRITNDGWTKPDRYPASFEETKEERRPDRSFEEDRSRRPAPRGGAYPRTPPRGFDDGDDSRDSSRRDRFPDEEQSYSEEFDRYPHRRGPPPARDYDDDYAPPSYKKQPPASGSRRSRDAEPLAYDASPNSRREAW